MESLPRFESGVLPASDGGGKAYVTIGDGPTPVVVVPGAADGVRIAVDVAPYLAWFYRRRARTCRLLILSRREPLPAGFGIDRHAEDLIETVEQLSWGAAVWECLSAGGPIGQSAAVRRPDLVAGLILASSFHRIADRTRSVFQQWSTMAADADGINFFWRMIEHKYRPPEEVLSQIDPARLASVARPRDPARLQRLLQELQDVEHSQVLPRIACPALIIGGADDRIVPADVQREMAALIARSRLEICQGFGHFNDMENPAYHEHVEHFVQPQRRPA
jgi:pimeloyl-ACP methyl ester carboxylesterase